MVTPPGEIPTDLAGFDLDDRIVWIVDDLVEAFRVTDMEKIMGNYGKDTQQTDPMMHFYEDFLRNYDPSAKKSCGVYYTPQPVVDFIVRAVDHILKTDMLLNSIGGVPTTNAQEPHGHLRQDLHTGPARQHPQERDVC